MRGTVDGKKSCNPSCREACPVLELERGTGFPQMSDRNTFVFKYISLIYVQDVYIYIYTHMIHMYMYSIRNYSVVGIDFC